MHWLWPHMLYVLYKLNYITFRGFCSFSCVAVTTICLHDPMKPKVVLVNFVVWLWGETLPEHMDGNAKNKTVEIAWKTKKKPISHYSTLISDINHFPSSSPLSVWCEKEMNLLLKLLYVYITQSNTLWSFAPSFLHHVKTHESSRPSDENIFQSSLLQMNQVILNISHLDVWFIISLATLTLPQNYTVVPVKKQRHDCYIKRG